MQFYKLWGVLSNLEIKIETEVKHKEFGFEPKVHHDEIFFKSVTKTSKCPVDFF